MNETGGDINDYVKLNQDYSQLDNLSLLKEYYKQTKPHLNSEEIDDEFNKNIELIVNDIHQHYDYLIKLKHPLVIINGGAGRPGSGMDSINHVAKHLREKGYNIEQIYCDINSGFPDEKFPESDIKVIKMGFDLRQLAVILGQEVYVLPGGYGTNYEFFQLETIKQLKQFGIDVTSTGLDFDHERVTLISNSDAFCFLNYHLKKQFDLGLVSEKELKNIRIIGKNNQITSILKP